MSSTRSKPLRPTTVAVSTAKRSHSTISVPRRANASSSAPEILQGRIGGTGGDDICGSCSDDGSETTPTNYLEKEMAYKKLNEELEKRSNEIFQKIEQYSNRSRRISISEAGDGDAPTGSDISCDGNTDRSSIGNPYASFFNSSRASTAKSSKTITKSESCESIGSSNCQKSYSVSASDKTVESVDMKARSRLQKATESVVKCLQSKLVSYESRLTDLHLQFRQKIQENTMLESKVRALEEDRERLLKSISCLQSSAEKFSKSADVAKGNLNLKMQAFSALKKDIDMLKREQRQKAAQIQNLQTRFNRCVEENDRLKNQTRSIQMNSREKQQEDRSLIDELQQKVSSLEQQKSILNATIGKQSNLIRALRTQKSGPDRGTFY